MTTAPRRLEVEAFTLAPSDDDGRPLHFTTDEDDFVGSPGLDNLGTVQVHLGVDLDHDKVVLDSGRTADLTVLDLAIAHLTEIREALAKFTPDAATGQCLGRCDWGRCKLPERHQGQHEGPTEAQWQAEHDALEAVRKHRSARIGGAA